MATNTMMPHIGLLQAPVGTEEGSSISNIGKDLSLPKNGPLGPFNDWPNDQGFDVTQEHRIPVELTVTGSIPAYAAGILYRTGPGGHTVQTEQGKIWTASHWFDGFTQVHRFQILPPENAQSSSRVFYNSRSTVDSLVENIRKTGSLQDFTFAQKRDPCQSFFKKIMAYFMPMPKLLSSKSDGRNIGVTISVNMAGLTPPRASGDAEGQGHASGITTLVNKTDANAYQFLDPETLEPVGIAKQSDLHPDLKGPLSAAHAKSDPTTGDIFNYNLEIGQQHVYRVFTVSASTGKTKILATITNTEGAYLHSFLLTENYVILCVWNSYYAFGGVKLLYERNILDALSNFDPSKLTKWYVVDRKHGKGVVATYESEPFFCFHTINAWETSSPTDRGKIDIVADLVAYDDLSVLKRFYYENLKSTSPSARNYVGSKGDSARASIKRFRLPSLPTSPNLATKAKEAVVVVTVPKFHSGELPTFNPDYITKRHRYVYGVADRGSSTFVDGLVKYDMDTKTPMFWEQHGHSAGEAIFVPNPEGKNEDDGMLLSVVLDGHAGKSYLLCLDARTMKEMGRAAVECAVGFGFHGTHFAENSGTGMQY
ncbi:MAG: hypothetical protein M1830_008861 [Pleopsidium flavum]|nr:MAG: hypothetical protein M1830_008861 [Pleopsidium flavum]